jgi:putative protease
MYLPELLAPAGSLDKLKVAISYGADAVYLGGQQFGLRSAAENFTKQELIEGVEFAHQHDSKVFVVLNSFLHDEDLEELPEFVQFIESIGVDAVIVSDLGVIKTVHEYSDIEVHLSTQASCLNIEAAKLWKEVGVTRVVLGREVSIADAKMIKKAAGVEVEMFIHGSMCMAYSGNCVISNFTQGRDSNRGGCAHSCRFEYSLDFEDEEQRRRAFFMSSKDLNGIKVLQEYIEAGIDSIKVEGRMKSHLYAGTISKVYREALDYYKEHGDFLSADLYAWEDELKKVTHRAYTEASLVEPAGSDSIFNEREVDSSNDYIMVGRVLDVIEDKQMILEVRNAFNEGDTIEILPFDGHAHSITLKDMRDIAGNHMVRTKPSTLIKLPYIKGVANNNIARMRVLS